MKKIVFLALLGTLSATWVFSQGNRFDLALEDSNIKEVLVRIEEASEYSFFYRDEELDLTRKYTNNFVGATITEVMDEILADQSLTYRISEMTIVILPTTDQEAGTGQNPSISGVVIDEKTGEVLLGVNIWVEDRNIGTVSDVDGEYTIEVPERDGTVLVYSYVGYYSQRIPLGENNRIDVALSEDIQSLDEVVVIGYGTQKKGDLTGAVGIVDVAEMKKVQTAGVAEALQGQVAGVSVRTTGAPGSWADVRIRGIGSFSNVGPLYVIDGLILNDANGINTADIESIQILKDASATAIYGSRGANGVVIITTKRGKKGAAKIDFSANYGWQELSKKMDMMNSTEYLYYNQLGYINGGEVWLGRPETGDTIPDTDWQDAIMQMGHVQDYNLSIGGGTDNSKYHIGAGYYSHEGVLKGPWYNRLTFRVNTETTKGRLTVGENFSYMRANQKHTNGGSFSNALQMPPVIPVYNPDEISGRGGYGYGNVMYPTYASNPVAIQESIDNTEAHNRIIGNLYAKIEILKGLIFKSSLGIDHWNGRHKIIDEEVTMRYLSVETRRADLLWEERVERTNLSFDNTLTYNLHLGKHSFEFLLGSTVENSKMYFLGNEGYDQSVDGKWQIDLAQVQNNMWGREHEVHIISYLGRLNYNFDDRYLLQANIRRDGSSKFGTNKKWGVFPSASLGWRISNESFFQPAKKVLSDLKLRLSYGSNGDQQALGAYDWIPSIDHSGPYEGLYYMFGGAIYEGAIQTERANPNVHWESKTTFNVGMDFGLIRNKLYGSVEWYKSISSGLLVRLPLAFASGVGVSFSGDDAFEWTNYGEMTNTGLEITLGWKDQIGEFRYNVSANFNTIKNEVIELGESFREGGFSNVNRTAEGRSVSEFYLIKTDGIFQSMDEVFDYTVVLEDGTVELIQPNAKPGDIRYEDFNQDGQIDLDDRQWLGSPMPKFEVGLNFSADYKGFDFTMFLTGVYGNKIFSVLRTGIETMDSPNNMPGYIDPWTWDNPSDIYPRPVKGTTDNAKAQTDRWLEDGSYIRLKNIQLGYSVPESLLRKTNFFQSCRVFVSGQNLVTFTKYLGYDPEIAGNDVFGQGNDYGGYPPVRTYTVGLQLSF
jgi:TonB-linked SusC/RagA family outer membrane protein